LSYIEQEAAWPTANTTQRDRALREPKKLAFTRPKNRRRCSD